MSFQLKNYLSGIFWLHIDMRPIRNKLILATVKRVYTPTERAKNKRISSNRLAYHMNDLYRFVLISLFQKYQFVVTPPFQTQSYWRRKLLLTVYHNSRA